MPGPDDSISLDLRIANALSIAEARSLLEPIYRTRGPEDRGWEEDSFDKP